MKYIKIDVPPNWNNSNCNGPLKEEIIDLRSPWTSTIVVLIWDKTEQNRCGLYYIKTTDIEFPVKTAINNDDDDDDNNNDYIWQLSKNKELETVQTY